MTAKLTENPRRKPLPHPARRHLAIPRSEARFALPQTARYVAAKAVGSFVPSLTRKAFEKFGFSTATLITDWPRIAGAELASYTLPDRLKWPRGAANADHGGEDDEGGRPGATLILRVDPARALDVEYRARQIMDRINAYFGYRAVETLRLVQAPVSNGQSARGSARAAAPTSEKPVKALLPLPPCGGGREGGNPNGLRSGIPPPLTPPHVEPKARLRREGEGECDDPLAAALARMERSVLARRPARPT
ncbi:DUF721 domain-containing protein [Hyphomicrobium sp.]|uniref:DUF721 domain-containing protein n=1 Tax=Hyphomicrobium sp. TaxID=82 RepID=UPI003F703BF1